MPVSSNNRISATFMHTIPFRNLHCSLHVRPWRSIFAIQSKSSIPCHHVSLSPLLRSSIGRLCSYSSKPPQDNIAERFGMNIRTSDGTDMSRVKVKKVDRSFIIEPDAPPGGFELAMYRCATIVTNIAERLNSRVLHFHCESPMVDYVEDGKYLAIDGVTDNEESIENVKAKKKYMSVAHIDYKDTKFPQYRPASYEFVVSTPPVSRSSTGPTLTEFLRLLNKRGYGILGMNRPAWDKYDIHNQIKQLDSDGKISFMSMQKVECSLDQEKKVDYIIAVFRKI